MKTTPTPVWRTPRLALAGLLALAFGSLQTWAFPIITNVVETGGDNEATDTIVAQWTGVTWNTTVANEPTLATPVGTPFLVPPFGNHAPTFVDRNHRYTNASATLTIPAYLTGGEYIMSGNDNRDNATYQLDISVSEPAVIFMLVDNRLTDGANGDPPNFAEGLDPTLWTLAMTWLATGGFQPLTNGINRTANLSWPDEVGIDEGSDGSINNWYSIYAKQVPAGMTSIFQPDNGGRNMYGVVVTPLAPPIPTGLNTISLNARLALNWNVSPGAKEYILRRSSTPGGPYTPIVTNTTTSYVDMGLVNFQNYYYVVSGVGLFGESANSAEVVGIPKLAPENLVAVGGTNQISLSWTALSGAASYTVKRADVSGGSLTVLAAGVAVTSYVDQGLPDGSRFYYTVSAPLTGGGESANADEAQAVTAPSTPANFGVELFGSTGAKLRWTTADAVDPTNLIERSTNAVNFIPVGVSTGVARVFLDAGLARSASYYYRIQATNSGGFSSYTSVASLTTPVYGINVNFANNTNADGGTTILASTLAGYVQDIGEMFGPHGSFNYGWDIDNTINGRWHQSPLSSDLRYDTLNHMQRPAGTSETWEIDVTNGLYSVHVAAGDPTATDSVFQFSTEGLLTGAFVPTAGNRWIEFTNTVNVTDGRLTITSGPGANNNKINYVDIYPTVDNTPPVLLSAARNSACAGDSLTVVFNEVLNASSALAAANYRVVNLTAGVSIGILEGSPALREDGQTVALTTSTPLTNGGQYQIIATNIQDVALNALIQGSASVALKGVLLPTPVGADWLLCAEAENPDSITPRAWRGVERTWVPTTGRAGYSGTGAMRALPNTEGDPRPIDAVECASLDFCVNFPESDTYPRTYYIWVRGAAEGGADDSCYVGLDGVINSQNLNQGWVVPGYTWSSADSIQLRVSVDIPSGGPHTIHVFLREDGFYCDKIVLTTDVNYAPASVNGGLGPDASTREGAVTPPTVQFIPGTLSYAGGAFSVNLQTIAGLTNVVEYKTSLDAASWTQLTNFLGDGSVKPITDSGPLPAARFYRARVIIP